MGFTLYIYTNLLKNYKTSLQTYLHGALKLSTAAVNDAAADVAATPRASTHIWSTSSASSCAACSLSWAAPWPVTSQLQLQLQKGAARREQLLGLCKISANNIIYISIRLTLCTSTQAHTFLFYNARSYPILFYFIFNTCKLQCDAMR